MARAFPGLGFEARILASLEALVGELVGRAWLNEAGTQIPLSRVLIDANWGKSTNIVYQFCRESPHTALLLPSHGRGIGASQKPLNDYQKKPGDQVGTHWRVPAVGKRAARHVVWDTNWWKTFAAERLRTGKGDPGSIGIFKGSAELHRMLIEHECSEYPVPVQGRGRKVDEWKLEPGRDNELWDGTVGCLVAGSMQGVATIGHVAAATPKRITLSQIQGRRL